MAFVMAEKDVENGQKIGIAGKLQVTVHGVLTTYPEPCLSPHIHRSLIQQIWKQSACKMVLNVS